MKKLIMLLLVVVAGSQAFGQSSAIRVKKSGAGAPVIFLPGFITPGSVWDETVKNLKGNRTSHLVSYAGFNGIDPIPMPWYETIKKELIAYAKTNKLTHLTLIGHSMGGNLVVDMAAELGSAVDRVVIVDALACMREVMMPGVPAEGLQYESKYNQQLLETPKEAFEKNALMMAQGMSANAEKHELLKSWIVEADRKTYVYGYTDLLKLDVRPALATIKVPVLILGAPFPTKEVVLPNFEKQYSTLANKTIEIAPGGRHYIMFDQPQWMYDQINNFLAR
jgi:pimeloyl-ACP methyl ester carboxylesterase